MSIKEKVTSFFKREDSGLANDKQLLFLDGSNTESPYLNARREWNERYGSYIKQAYDWKIMGLVSMTVSVVLAVGLIVVLKSNRLVPYIIQIDNSGSVVKSQIAVNENTFSDNIVRAAIMDWLTHIRTVSSDFNLTKSFQEKAFAHLSGNMPATKTINEYYETGFLPLKRMKVETVTLEIESALPVSKNSWQIEWTEIVKSRDGSFLRSEKYSGFINVVFVEVTDSLQATINPMGLFIKDFNWNQRM
jgi:type IV secretory pathway TrbF-like protein